MGRKSHRKKVTGTEELEHTIDHFGREAEDTSFIPAAIMIFANLMFRS